MSAGPFGETRVTQSLLPVMRELGLVTIFCDVDFLECAKDVFRRRQASGESYIRRIDTFLKYLIWRAASFACTGSGSITVPWGELLEVDFAVPEKDRLYRCLDRILEHKPALFQHPAGAVARPVLGAV